MTRLRVLVIAAILTVVLPLGALGVLWLGATASLDWQRQHTAATDTLPEPFSASAGLARIEVDGLVFRARVAGFGGTRGNLIMLHGFAQSSAMWQPMLDAAAQAGYRAVAFDQRGYSPGARPHAPAEYELDALLQDVRRVAQAMGFTSFHLLGSGLGARIGWRLILQDPRGIDSWTTLTMPHVQAFQHALEHDPEQRRRSRLLRLLKLPWLPERVLAFNDFEILRNSLWAPHPRDHVAEYVAILAEPDALGAILNWHRVPWPKLPYKRALSVPTLLIWGNSDPFLAHSTVAAHRQLVNSARELELDAGHALLGTHAALVTDAVLQHLQSAGN